MHIKISLHIFSDLELAKGDLEESDGTSVETGELIVECEELDKGTEEDPEDDEVEDSEPHEILYHREEDVDQRAEESTRPQKQDHSGPADHCEGHQVVSESRPVFTNIGPSHMTLQIIRSPFWNLLPLIHLVLTVESEEEVEYLNEDLEVKEGELLLPDSGVKGDHHIVTEKDDPNQVDGESDLEVIVILG